MIQKFPANLRILHWVLAVLLAILFFVGLYMHELPSGPDKIGLYAWHRAFGVLAFLLIIARLVIRYRSDIPPLPQTIPLRERQLADIGRIAMYVSMALIPIFGYLGSSATPDKPGVPPLDSIWFFGIPLPVFPIGKSEETHELFMELHEIAAFALVFLVIVHVAGALKHRFFDKNPENDVLKRML